MRTFSDGRFERLELRVGEYPYKIQRLQMRETKAGSISPKRTSPRANRESGRIGKLWGLESEPRFTLPLRALRSRPCHQEADLAPSASSTANPRALTQDVTTAPHEELPVMATATGTVKIAEEHFFAGKSVFLDHGGGLISMYFHLDEILVEEGEQVDRGQVVGKVGSTGRSTGPHLHFGLRYRAKRIDPEPLMKGISAIPAVSSQ